jgi:hypothetical protein
MEATSRRSMMEKALGESLLRSHWRALVAIAVVAFAASWCFPVLYTPPDVPTYPNAKGVVDYGWQAMLTALGPLLDPTRPLSAADLFGQIAWAMSGLSNLLFVAVAALLLLQRTRPVARRIEVAMWVAIAANLMWFTQGISYLRIGYYLWVLSFVILELAVHERRRVGQSLERGSYA